MSCDYKIIRNLVATAVSKNNKSKKEKVTKLENICNMYALEVCEVVLDIMPRNMNKNLLELISHLIELNCDFRKYIFSSLQYFCHFVLENHGKSSFDTHSLQFYFLQKFYSWFKAYKKEYPHLIFVYNYFYHKSDLKFRKIIDQEKSIQIKQEREANFLFYKIYSSRIHLIHQILNKVPEIENVIIELESIYAFITPTLENFDINLISENSGPYNDLFFEEILDSSKEDSYESGRLHGLFKSDHVYQINIPINASFASNDPIIISTIQEKHHLLKIYCLLIDDWQQIMLELQKHYQDTIKKFKIKNLPSKNDVLTSDDLPPIISLDNDQINNIDINNFLIYLEKYYFTLMDYKYKPYPSFHTNLDFMWFEILNRIFKHLKSKIVIHKERCHILLCNYPKSSEPEVSDDSNSSDFIEVEE